jgi:hypothetical protein
MLPKMHKYMPAISISNANNSQPSQLLQISIPHYIANSTEKIQITSLQFHLLSASLLPVILQAEDAVHRGALSNKGSWCGAASHLPEAVRRLIPAAARRLLCLQQRGGPSAGGGAGSQQPAAA